MNGIHNPTQSEPEGRYECAPDRAATILSWLRTRGGIATWHSVNLSNPGASWTTPLNQEDGKRTEKPSWQVGNDPIVITDPAKVFVYTPKKVAEVKVKLEIAGQMGQKLQLTDGSSSRLKKALAKWGPTSYYKFQASGAPSGDAVHGLLFGEDIAEIYVTEGDPVPILDWEKTQAAPIAK